MRDGACVVAEPGIAGIDILGEDEELARVVGPVAQKMKVERALHGSHC